MYRLPKVVDNSTLQKIDVQCVYTTDFTEIVVEGLYLDYDDFDTIHLVDSNALCPYITRDEDGCY